MCLSLFYCVLCQKPVCSCLNYSAFLIILFHLSEESFGFFFTTHLHMFVRHSHSTQDFHLRRKKCIWKEKRNNSTALTSRREIKYQLPLLCLWSSINWMKQRGDSSVCVWLCVHVCMSWVWDLDNDQWSRPGDGFFNLLTPPGSLLLCGLLFPVIVTGVYQAGCSSWSSGINWCQRRGTGSGVCVWVHILSCFINSASNAPLAQARERGAGRYPLVRLQLLWVLGLRQGFMRGL